MPSFALNCENIYLNQLFHLLLSNNVLVHRTQFIPPRFSSFFEFYVIADERLAFIGQNFP